MSFRALAFSDLHLNDEEDFDADPLKRVIASRSKDEEIDAIISLGDVVDNIPRDRELEKSDPEEDITLGRSFFGQLNEVYEEQNIPTYAIPGNHDYDIFDEIIRNSDGDFMHGVVDARGSEITSIDDKNYGIIGASTKSFDIGPEINPEKYDIEDLDHFLSTLGDMVTIGSSIEHAADELSIDAEDYAEFYDDAEEFVRDFELLEREFEQVYEHIKEEETLFLSHIAPFNTCLDSKTIGGDSREHQGSLVNRAILDYFRPNVALNGHHDYHSIDYLEDDSGYGLDIYAVGLDEATPTEIVLDNGSLSVQEN